MEYNEALADEWEDRGKAVREVLAEEAPKLRTIGSWLREVADRLGIGYLPVSERSSIAFAGGMSADEYARQLALDVAAKAGGK